MKKINHVRLQCSSAKLVVFCMSSLLLFEICRSDSSQTNQTTEKADAMSFLSQFGYMKGSEINAEALLPDEKLSDYIKEFQEFANLKVTGQLDSDTIKKMKEPRCGFPDKSNSPSDFTANSFVLEGNKWSGTDLTYKVLNYPSTLSTSDTDQGIQRAFDVWSKITPLTFARKSSGKTNIEISFVERNHNDQYPFDGPGVVLAHAYFPQSGIVHFDNEEDWSMNSKQGSNLLQIAAHEFGHSLGLKHSSTKAALMYPYYSGYDPNFKLNDDDIAGMQTLYGSKSTDSAGPDLCRDGTIDTIFSSSDGITYVFKGSHYWKLTESGRKVENGYPKLISSKWPELPDNIDAAFTSKNGRTYFFKGSLFWKYNGLNLDGDNPKQISNVLPGIPNNVDGAMWFTPKDKAYFFKGNQFWVYDPYSTPSVKSKYPKLINELRGVPNNLDDAFFTNNRIFFFKQGQYFRFNISTYQVDEDNPPFPRNTGTWWFGC